MQNEIWKEYPNDSDFSVSNLGRVKVKARTSKDGRAFKGKILKQTLSSRKYYNVKINKYTRTAHQLVAETFLDHTPCGYKLVVNHINFNKLDNRVSNLEIVTARENTNKKHLKSSSEFVGVYWNKKAERWTSEITINGSKKYLGRFKCELAAANAYQTALKELHVNGI